MICRCLPPMWWRKRRAVPKGRRRKRPMRRRWQTTRPASLHPISSGILCRSSPNWRGLWCREPPPSEPGRARLGLNQPQWGRARSPWDTTPRRLARLLLRRGIQSPSVMTRKRAGEIPLWSARARRLCLVTPQYSARGRVHCTEALRCLAKTLRPC